MIQSFKSQYTKSSHFLKISFVLAIFLFLSSLLLSCNESLNSENINLKPSNKNELIESIKQIYDTEGRSADLNRIDTSLVTDMSELFSGVSEHSYSVFGTGDVSKWNTSQVTNMESMFYYRDYFNQPIGNWDVSKVENMNSMFAGADSFNQDISSWDTSQVTDMGFMFAYTEAFNQPISNWNTSKVTNVGQMFFKSTAFNQNLDNWNIPSSAYAHRAFTGSLMEFNRPRWCIVIIGILTDRCKSLY